jgi:hypothetical protein
MMNESSPQVLPYAPPPKGRRRFSEPPGWILMGFTIFPAMGILYMASLPGGGGINWVFAIFWAALLTVGYVVRMILSNRAAFTHRGRWRWFFVPLVMAVTVVLTVMDLPWRWRFAYSEPAFDKVVSAVMADPAHTPPAPQWVGLFYVDEFEYKEGCLRMWVGEHAAFTWAEAWPSIRPSKQVRLHGHWYFLNLF